MYFEYRIIFRQPNQTKTSNLICYYASTRQSKISFNTKIIYIITHIQCYTTVLKLKPHLSCISGSITKEY